MSEKVEKKERDPQKIRIYKEIKASLWRDKNKAVDKILNEGKFLDDVIQDVDLAINDYERTRALFKQYIFEGTVPEYDMDYEEAEDEIDDVSEDFEEVNDEEPIEDIFEQRVVIENP